MRIAKIIRYLCITLSFIFLIVLILESTAVIELGDKIIRSLYYGMLVIWFIAILTKFVPQKHNKTKNK